MPSDAGDPRPSAPSFGTLAVAATAIACLTTVHSLRLYLPSYNTPHTSLEGVTHAPSELPSLPGVARRLTVVVVDGLSFERARPLEELAELRRAGVFRSLRADFPTYTSPAITSLVTGVGARDSGTRLNGDLDGVRGLDTVLRAASDAGVPIRVRSRGWKPFERILAPPETADVRPIKVGLIAEVLVRGLAGEPQLPPLDGKTPARALDFVYLAHVDDAGHQHGGASREYTEAARTVSTFLTRYVRSLDLEQDSLIAVSDHGHLPGGGHGGVEREVVGGFFLGVGGVFRRGVELGERPMRDVASTIALLAGVRTPSSNLGRPMIDALSLEDEIGSLALAAPFDQATRMLCAPSPLLPSPSPRCAEIPAILARLRKADPEAWHDAEALHDALTAERDASLAALGRDRARGRFIRAAAILAALVVTLFLAARRWFRLSGGVNVVSFVPPIVNAAVFAAYLRGLSYAPTFSVMRPGNTFMAHSVPGGFLAVAAVAAFAWIARPPRLSAWVLLLVTALPFALFAAWIGWDPAILPPPIEGVLVFLCAPAVVSAAVGAAAMEIVRSYRRA